MEVSEQRCEIRAHQCRVLSVTAVLKSAELRRGASHHGLCLDVCPEEDLGEGGFQSEERLHQLDKRGGAFQAVQRACAKR